VLADLGSLARYRPALGSTDLGQPLNIGAEIISGPYINYFHLNYADTFLLH